MVFLVQAVMLSGSIMFVYCYYGEMATESFENIADALYESNWQNLSIQLQKYYILMIGNAQRPLYYHGFHVSILSLNTFAKVMQNCELFSTFHVHKNELPEIFGLYRIFVCVWSI